MESTKNGLLKGTGAPVSFIIKRRKKQAIYSIYRLKNPLDQAVYTQEEVTSILHSSFKSRSTSNVPSSRHINLSFIISQEEVVSLLTQVSDYEIKNAFFNINPLKAPRSDGFGAIL